MAAAAKSITNEQLVPEATLDGCDPELSWGQVLLPSNVKPAEMLGHLEDRVSVTYVTASALEVTTKR
jgi:hypothetical protein